LWLSQTELDSKITSVEEELTQVSADINTTEANLLACTPEDKGDVRAKLAALRKEKEQLRDKEKLLLEEKKDLRQQQQAAAPSAGARAQCVFARAFSGLFVGGLLLLVLGVVCGVR
jgi:chromosome segregation ATPase